MNPEPNTNNDLQSVTDFVDVAGRMKASTVVIAGGDRVEDLSLVESARDHGIVERMDLLDSRLRGNDNNGRGDRNFPGDYALSTTGLE